MRAVAADLPAGGPPALYRPEPAWPSAGGWPGPESFPRTSGTGRLDDGALLWTDWLYDDHGARTAPVTDPAQTAGSPSFGGYGYDDPAAHGNGADLFRAGVLLRDDATYWRVDWTTLSEPSVPLAVWTFDRDSSPGTGTAEWPADAGLTSPGIDTALVVSGQRAQLLSLPDETVLVELPVTVDLDAHAFVVRVPTDVLAPSGEWTVRLAAGLADDSGTSFAPATGALPGQTPVYNVTFRDRDQEPTQYCFWSDCAQVEALTAGDVSAFSTAVDWGALRDRTTTADARPTGYSTRWYVSSVEQGDGVLTGPQTVQDGEANYLGRLQPYTVYVPAGAPSPAPLTFLLHSLTQNHNQYAATTPRFVRLACEQRRSICATPLGRGGDGYYLGTAQLDFWEVWREVAEAYDLDVDRTVLSGYSMGGLGSNAIGMAHPDLFAQVVALAGAVGNVPELENLRHVPVYLAGGALDELVPVTVHRAQADGLDELGYRYRWLVHAAEDHVSFELRDGFDDAAAFMADARRTSRPARFTFRWNPLDTGRTYDPVTGSEEETALATVQRPDLGVGTTGAYWVHDLVARDGAPYGRVDAVSAALPDPAVQPVRSDDVVVPGQLSPAVVQQLEWQLGAAGPTADGVTLDLTGVAAATLDMPGAGLPLSGCSAVTVRSDGASTLVLDGGTVTTDVAVDEGERSMLVRTTQGAAPQVVTLCGSGTTGAPTQVRATLPRTGAGAATTAIGVLLIAAAAVTRRSRQD